MPRASGNFAVEAMMDVQQGAEAVLHMASLPLSANVQFMTIMATKMLFVGGGRALWPVIAEIAGLVDDAH